MIKEITLFKRRVQIDIDKLSKGLCAMHEEDEGMKTRLAFGMLDFNLCQTFEQELTASIKAQFSSLTNELCKEEIEAFIKLVNKEATKGVYRYAKMIV